MVPQSPWFLRSMPGRFLARLLTFGLLLAVMPTEADTRDHGIGSDEDATAFDDDGEATSSTLRGLCDGAVVVDHLGDDDSLPPLSYNLRRAMLYATANPFGCDQVQIVFDLAVQCPATIFLDSPLPDITGGDAQVYINGYSQPGSSPNSASNGNNAVICVWLQPSAQAGTLSYALRVPVGSPAQLRLAGIGLGGFSSAVQLFGGSGHLVRGNRFGGSGLSNDLPGNGIGVWLTGGSDAVEIGSLFLPSHRNTFAGNGFAAVLVDGSAGIQIHSNYIGTDPDGSTAIGNGFGVIVSNAAGADIADNVISGNQSDGLLLSGPGTFDALVTDNRIGLKRRHAAGGSALGNGGSGVRVIAGHDNAIGGTASSLGNTIADNGEGGVVIESGRRNRISRNAIFGNVGLGIDLAEPGVNPNDDDSAILPADYANRSLNFPLLASAGGSTYAGTVIGSLTTTPGTYRIEFFANSGRGCDFSGHGEGVTYIGAVDVTIPVQNPGPPQGTAAFSTTVISSGGLPGRIITATATDENGNTSEFSACKQYVGDDLIFADGFEGG